MRERPERWVALADSGDHLAVFFPFDRPQVEEFKRVPGAKWRRVAHYWEAPVSSRAAVLDFADRFDLGVDAEVLRLNIPGLADVGVRLVDTVGGQWVSIRFAYEPVKVLAVEELPLVVWDRVSRAWLVPVSHVAEAVMWADRFRLPVDDTVRARI